MLQGKFCINWRWAVWSQQWCLLTAFQLSKFRFSPGPLKFLPSQVLHIMTEDLQCVMISTNILQSNLNVAFTHSNKMWDSFDEMSSRASLAALRNRLQWGWDRGSWGQVTWLLEVVPAKVFYHMAFLGAGSTVRDPTLHLPHPQRNCCLRQGSFYVTLALLLCK